MSDLDEASVSNQFWSFAVDLDLAPHRDGREYLRSRWIDLSDGSEITKNPPGGPLSVALRSTLLGSDKQWNVPGLAELRNRFYDGIDYVGEASETDVTREIGAALFRAVLPGSSADALLACFATAVRNGFYVKIVLNLSPELEELPWELLNAGTHASILSESAKGFLALDYHFSIVRTGSRQGEPVAARQGPMRMLVVDAGGSPLRYGGGDRKLPALGKDERGNSLGDTTERLALISEDGARVLAGARVSYEDVIRPLGSGNYNVFHFSGHGVNGIVNKSESPVILFASEARKDVDGVAAGDPVAPGRLGDDLHQAGVELAVVAACHAGVGAWWAGFGAGLLAAKVPAVVSMQALLEDQAGDLFCSKLYERLRQGSTVDSAVSAGRRHLYERARYKDWWLPMLHAKSEMRFVATAQAHRPKTGSLSLRPPRPSDGTLFIRVGRGDPQVWRSPRGGATNSTVLAPDGRAFAQADVGAVVVGLLDSQAQVHSYWEPVAIPQLDSLHAIQMHPRHAELLVTVEGAVQTMFAYPDGTSSVRSVHHGRATHGAWVSEAFWWVDENGELNSDEAKSFGRLPPTNVRALDAVVGADVWMVAVATSEELFVERRVVQSGVSELRVAALDGEPSALCLVRVPDGEPDEIRLGPGPSQSEWNWQGLGRR